MPWIWNFKLQYKLKYCFILQIFSFKFLKNPRVSSRRDWFQKEKGVIYIQSGKPLKLVDQFTYLSSNISSTESDVIICLMKLWNANDRLYR